MNQFDSRARTLLAYAALILTAFLWGIAFVPQKAAMSKVGPLIFNAARFFVPGVVLLPIGIVLQKRRRTGTIGFSAATLLGILLFLGALFQQLGVVTTEAGKAGFVTGLYLVLVPLFLAIFWRERQHLRQWGAAFLALLGLALLTLNADLSIVPGDALVLVCAIAYALHVIMVGKRGANLHPLILAGGQYCVCGLLSFFAALIAGESLDLLPAWREIVFMVLGSSGVAYTLQIIAQPHVSTSSAAVILGLESVFAALGGWVFLGEILGALQISGCVLMFLATLISAYAPVKARAPTGEL